jgi:isopenicillin N synthase-like dioxygenase
MKPNSASHVPVIDIKDLISDNTGKGQVASAIRSACIEHGFFYISGHGVDVQLQRDLEDMSQRFFSLPLEEKLKIRMELGGRAWRGFFPVGDELTSGKPDLKEGIYFGEELGLEDERVGRKLLLHGANLFPEGIDGFREVVLEFMDRIKVLGHHLMRGLSLSLGLEEDYLNKHYMSDPLILFRIFHYPASDSHKDLGAPWGVGEHTDYGVLTILKQDTVGGLQVKTRSGWIAAPYIPGTFVCNIGDMLERLTRGLYKSTPHRVLNTSGRDRFSYPFFFDPGFDAFIIPLPIPEKDIQNSSADRWDLANVHEFEGTYGDYILAKVAKVFPNLEV